VGHFPISGGHHEGVMLRAPTWRAAALAKPQMYQNPRDAPDTHPLKTEKHIKLKRGQLNNYKRYQKKMNYKVTANNFINILNVELFL